jgi:hypothetical protein
MNSGSVTAILYRKLNTLSFCNIQQLYHELSTIWGFHSSGYEESYLLGYNAV